MFVFLSCWVDGYTAIVAAGLFPTTQFAAMSPVPPTIPTPSAAARPPVGLASPARWLALGWADLLRNPLPGLFHGCLLSAFGALLFWAAGDQFWLLAGAFSGFLIVAPVLATGLFQVSRSQDSGRRVGMAEVVSLWRSGDRRLMVFGLLLGVAGTGWVLTSAGLITLWSPVPIQEPADFLSEVVLAQEIGLFEAWLVLGALLAAPVFASSVVALPMLVDTNASIMTAVSTSWRAVADHPGPMVVWALVIVLLVGLGMAAALLGLIVIVPLIAHASWHAYRDLTSHPAPSVSSTH